MRVSPLEIQPAGGPRWVRQLPALVLALFCLDIGIVLILLPWSPFWDRNYFFPLAPQWGRLFASGYLRGAVSGLGLVNVWIGLSEGWRRLRA